MCQQHILLMTAQWLNLTAHGSILEYTCVCCICMINLRVLDIICRHSATQHGFYLQLESGIKTALFEVSLCFEVRIVPAKVSADATECLPNRMGRMLQSSSNSLAEDEIQRWPQINASLLMIFYTIIQSPNHSSRISPNITQLCDTMIRRGDWRSDEHGWS